MEWVIKPWVLLGMLTMFSVSVFTLRVNCHHSLTHHVLHMSYLPALVSFCVIVIKSKVGEKGVYYGPQFEGTVHHDGKSQQQKPKAAGYMASTIRKLGIKHCLQFPFSLIYSPGASQ